MTASAARARAIRIPEASDPPYEMINASLSQGAEDIRAVLDWLQLNPRLKASPVILVSFSLSALEARIAAPGRSVPPADQLLDRLHGHAGIPGSDEPGQLRAGPPRTAPARHRPRHHPHPRQPHQHEALCRRRRREPRSRPSTRPGRTCATSTSRSPGSTASTTIGSRPNSSGTS